MDSEWYNHSYLEKAESTKWCISKGFHRMTIVVNTQENNMESFGVICGYGSVIKIETTNMGYGRVYWMNDKWLCNSGHSSDLTLTLEVHNGCVIATAQRGTCWDAVFSPNSIYTTSIKVDKCTCAQMSSFWYNPTRTRRLVETSHKYMH
jgi:hypothetical protein